MTIRIWAMETALRVFTKERMPTIWAWIQHDLGIAYQQLSTGDQNANIICAIACHESAQSVFTEQKLPRFWARTQICLGNAYDDLSEGDKSTNILQVIYYYEAAQRVFTEKTSPPEWAMLQSRLGKAFTDLPTGDIYCNVEHAILCCQDAVRIYLELQETTEWARALVNLGYAYQSLPTDNKIKFLECAIVCYETALPIFNESQFPRERAGILGNLCAVYGVMPSKEPGENQRRAIDCCEAILRIATEQNLPLEWAMAQTNLAGIYASLFGGDKKENFERALACYASALRIFTKEVLPIPWAKIQNNLGLLFRHFRLGDRYLHLEQAIAYCEAALSIFTEEETPQDWAMAQNNLAGAYQELAAYDGGKNLHRTIERFEAALRVYTEEDFRCEWAQIQNNIANVYCNLYRVEGQVHLSSAIPYCEAALRVFNEENFPLQWAMTQANLGLIYCGLGYGDSSHNFEHAVTCFTSALRIFTEEQFPLLWSVTQGNLAVAYRELPTDDQESYVMQAIDCCKAALRLPEPDSVPIERLRNLSNLSMLYLQLQEWEAGLDTCRQTLATLEKMRIDTLIAPQRQSLLAQNSQIIDYAIICCIYLEHFDEALVIAERSKTRNLLDALTCRNIPPHKISEQDWRAYLELRAALHEREMVLGGLRLYETEAVDQVQQLRHEHEDLSRQIAACEQQFRIQEPDYLPTAPALTITDICRIVQQNQTVLVEFRVTLAETFVFLSDGNEETLTERNVVTIADFSEDELQELLHAPEGWLECYHKTRSEQENPNQAQADRAWLSCMEQTLLELGTCLMEPVYDRIQELYPNATQLVIVPNKGLNLIPLHACPLKKEGKICLLDRYDVSYAPSLGVLRPSLGRKRMEAEEARLFAVQNPTSARSGDLSYADWDVIASAWYVGSAHILAEMQATRERVLAGIEQADEIIFACHGSYDMQHVEASYLQLSGTETLLMTSLLNRDLSRAWLVVLNACETALTDHRDSVDEVQGLHTAFLVARAATAIGTLWEVDDLPAALLIHRFHYHLYREGKGKAEALSAAARWLRRLTREEGIAWLEAEWGWVENHRNPEVRGQEKKILSRIKSRLKGWPLSPGTEYPFAHPVYWAAFLCHGQP